jgi:hypothetical protein
MVVVVPQPEATAKIYPHGTSAWERMLYDAVSDLVGCNPNVGSDQLRRDVDGELPLSELPMPPSDPAVEAAVDRCLAVEVTTCCQHIGEAINAHRDHAIVVFRRDEMALEAVYSFAAAPMLRLCLVCAHRLAETIRGKAGRCDYCGESRELPHARLIGCVFLGVIMRGCAVCAEVTDG